VLYSARSGFLANLAERNLAQLTALVETRFKRMQYRPGLRSGFRLHSPRPQDRSY
jgi:hypothetical protein